MDRMDRWIDEWIDEMDEWMDEWMQSNLQNLDLAALRSELVHPRDHPGVLANTWSNLFG